MVHRTIPHVFILFIFLCGTQVVWGETSHTSSVSSIALDRPIHFLAVDGSDVLIPPGDYQVEAAEEWLRLVPGSHIRADAWLIEAHASTHEEPLASPMAVSVQDEASPDVHRLVLLLPDGRSLEAVGSYSGVRSRGMTRFRTSRITGKHGKVETADHAPDSKLQIYFNRLDIISDGDPFGSGEITFVVTLLHDSPRCPKDTLPPHYRKCGAWRYIKELKAKSGETKQIKYSLPDNAKYIAVQSTDAVYLFLSVFEKDPGNSVITNSDSYPSPVTAFTRVNGWGVGSHSVVINGGIDVGNERVEVRLHYRVTSGQSDLKLEDFWTVPRVPNSGYEKTRVCVKVANIGNAHSSFFTPQLYMDNIIQAYLLPRQEGLPPLSKPGNRQTYCGMMPTPAEGKHRLAVRLRTEEFDFNTGNNHAEKELVSQKRMTQEEAWKRVWGQVKAFGDHVRQLKAALNLNGAALPHLPKGIRPVSWHSPYGHPLFNESGMFLNSSGKLLRVAGPSRFDKRKGFKKSPPRRARQNQQELLQLVANIRNRAVNIQSEAQMLRGAYLDLQNEAAAKKTAELMGVAKQYYQRCLNLRKAILDSNVPKIEEGVRVLQGGHTNMTKRLKLLQKF